MNDKIKELSDIAYRTHLLNHPNSSFGRRSDYDKMFAELIIRECINVCEGYRGTNYGKASECISDRIKEQFGIE